MEIAPLRNHHQRWSTRSRLSVDVVYAKLYAILRLNLNIFDCQQLVEGDDQDEYVMKFIWGQRNALEGLADQLKNKTGLSL
ncbi:NmrA-like family domain-containing protein [Fusarium oxysporum f. sp. albedinis]|nr:NmrA-like family domain-containing protein [Fusarium oxysporum f. sp. albedinis]